jgi:dTDP-4-dehydrorhamnose reductase
VTRRAFVLGHRGMLGHVAARRAVERGYALITSEERFTGRSRDALVEAVRASHADVVLNCLGCTPARSLDPWEHTLANALLPLQLGIRIRPDQLLVHASTDCVFVGTRGGYAVGDERDATDPYGFSKALGEEVARRPNVVVMRTSIVGPNPAAPRGLMAWFLAQPETVDVPGYANHRWNGITTLDWADLALDLAETALTGTRQPAIVQPATGVITKYQLLCALRDAAAPKRRVHPVAAPGAVDRSLIPTMLRPPIDEQLERLRAWYPLASPAR